MAFEFSPTPFALGFQLTWGRRLALTRSSSDVSGLQEQGMGFKRGGCWGPFWGQGSLWGYTLVLGVPVLSRTASAAVLTRIGAKQPHPKDRRTWPLNVCYFSLAGPSAPSLPKGFLGDYES